MKDRVQGPSINITWSNAVTGPIAWAHVGGWPSLSLCAWLACVAQPVWAGEVDFNAEVLPILTRSCFTCHGPDDSSRVTDFRIDSWQSVTAELDGGRAIVPGAPEQSQVLRRILSTDPGERMPPAEAGQSLSSEEVAVLRQWIQEGAKYETHWAFLQVRRPQVPCVARPSPRDSDIDRFVRSKLQTAGLDLSPPVDKRSLLRRVTYDLIGLPPTWEEVEAFVEDDSNDAYARVVDRLLASPQYGERWGRHWLDVARYADTHGGGAVGFKRFAFSYTYRDYVIAAFNRDLPYHQFIVEQIAADQLGLPEHDPALAALGFLTVGRQYPNLHDIIDDHIDVVSRGMLGLTVACARCHDHKYDAIPTRDYYAWYATFASSHAPEELPELTAPASVQSPIEPSPAKAAYEEELQQRKFRRQEMIREQSEVLRQRLKMQVGLYLKELVKGTPEQDLAMAFLSYRTDDYRPLVLDRWRKYLAQFDAGDAVFGPWHQLLEHRERPPAEFASLAMAVIDKLIAENGDISQLKLHALATQPPRWNPRVLASLKARIPQSMLDVADAYGELLARVQEEWLTGLSAAAGEARSGGAVIPDEDAAHTVLNSSVDRQLRYHLNGPETPTALPDAVASVLLNRPINDHVSGLGGAIDELHLNSPGSPPRAMLLVEDPQPQPARIFRRGNPLDRGEIVQPAFLQVLCQGRPTVFRDGQRRLGLAKAIADPANPLTRRVLVNWVWQRHFGQGLVRTADDFGVRGERPTHPELLDYLAETFMTLDGWSLKKLHRRIVLTQVYQQSSVEDLGARRIDPENLLLWRMPRRRLEAEAMRDAMLAASDRLDLTMGGKPVELFSEPFAVRRSVYGFINRDVIAGYFSAFDMADPSVCAVKRPQTTVPQQTLFALNSHFIQSQAQGLTEREEFRAAAGPRQRIEVLFQCALTRLPEDTEIVDALEYVETQSAADGADRAWQSLAHVLLASNEFIFLD